jgi:mannose-1-phosphate guanylyltransferase
VLTAGLGLRLRPLSYARAKAALPVAGVPLVARILRWLSSWNIRDAVLNLHHRPETITGLIGDGSQLDLRVRYSWENPVLGSGGGPRQALSFFDRDPMLIVNGDTLTELNLDAMIEHHRQSGARVTMALIDNPDPSKYGGVMVDREGWVTGFGPKGAPGPNLHFIGIQLATRSVFESLPASQPAETVGSLYPRLIREDPQSIKAFVSRATFHDIGTPRDYLSTSLAFARAEKNPGGLIGNKSTIHSTAELIDSVVWDRVTVQANCRLTRAVVADDVTIPAGSEFRDMAIVRAGGRVPAGRERLIGDLLVTEIDHT